MGTTKTQAVADAGRILAEARARRDAMTVREAAEAAYTPGGPSVDDLARLIGGWRSVGSAA